VILCVYALISASSPRVVATGVAGERLRAIRSGGITAVVGALRRPPKPTVPQLRRYAEAINAVARRAPAVLPVRFGTCMADQDEISAALRLRQDTLRTRLRAVRGRVQMTLRFPMQEQGSDESADGIPFDLPENTVTVNTRTEGTRYLQRRAAAAAHARAVGGLGPIRVAAKRWIKDERIEKRAGVATINHLIPRSSVGAYRAAVERAAAAATVQLVISGPHAAYAFADNW
jgi:hypothetical protein